MSFTEDELQSFNTILEQRLQAHQMDMERALDQRMDEYRRELYQQLEQIHSNDSEVIAIATDGPAQLEAIEVQTELSWEDLMDIIGKALDDRLAVLNDAIQSSLKNLEHYLSVRLHSLRDEFLRSKTQGQGYHVFSEEDPTNIQELLHGIEHLEHIIESMQVVMTSNHALLSNRLYHHQLLSFERAHSANDHTNPISHDENPPITVTEERITNGVEPEEIAGQAQMEE